MFFTMNKRFIFCYKFAFFFSLSIFGRQLPPPSFLTDIKYTQRMYPHVLSLQFQRTSAWAKTLHVTMYILVTSLKLERIYSVPEYVAKSEECFGHMSKHESLCDTSNSSDNNIGSTNNLHKHTYYFAMEYVVYM